MKSFLGHFSVALVYLLLLPEGWSAAPEAGRPNVLIIQTDEHNFRTLGCYRNLMDESQAMVWGPEAKVETPHIDALAARGATCTSCYATSPVCSPSRGALVSGMYPQNTPVYTNNIPLSDDIITFAELLRRTGYATGYAGKWHLDGGGKPQWAPKRKFGFDDNRYMFNRGHWKQFEDTPEGPRVKARKGNKPTYGVQGADEKSFATDYLADRAVDYIRAHKDEPFCYMVALPDPHGPNTVRPPYDTMYDGMKFEAPRTMGQPMEGNPTWAAPQVGKFNPDLLRKYFGMVKCIDDNVGKIVKELESAGILDRTIVIFTADHGDLCYEHSRHNKGVPMEGSAKIPFVIAWPGNIPAGIEVKQAMGTVDFLPTLLGLMSVKTAGREEGQDLSASLRGKPAPAGSSEMTFVRACAAGDSPTAWLMAVDSRYKLVLCNASDPWLFDLEKDPDELVNEFANPARRDVVRRLGKGLLDYAIRTKDPFAKLPYLKQDLNWVAEAKGNYATPQRDLTKKKKKK